MLRRVNLNLLPVLRVLLKERNVSRAGDILGLSQSGTSTALRRLRETLDDPLLVQVGQQMVLTERAEALILPLEQAVGQLEKIFEPVRCEPSTLRRRFKIWSVDYIVLRMAEQLIPRLTATAPGVSVRFIDLSTEALDMSLGRGDADLAMVPVSVKPGDSHIIDTELLFHDEYIAVVNAKHPLAAEIRLTHEHLAQYSCVAFHSGVDEWNVDQQRMFAGYGGDVSPVIQLQQFSTLPLIAATTDTIAIAPRTAAAWIQQITPLKILELPGPRIAHEIHLMWSSVHTHDPVHEWFRNLIIDVCRA